MRKFYKVSDKEYEKFKELFLKDDIIIPGRQTQKSSGYDFTSPHDLLIKSGEVGLIYTGIKAKMEDDEFLMLVIRSSKGRKEGLVLANQVGIIDADYYENIDNDGDIIVAIRNVSESDKKICKGDRICQGIFMKYLTVSDEVSIEKKRLGGFGSTNKL